MGNRPRRGQVGGKVRGCRGHARHSLAEEARPAGCMEACSPGADSRRAVGEGGFAEGIPGAIAVRRVWVHHLALFRPRVRVGGRAWDIIQEC